MRKYTQDGKFFFMFCDIDEFAGDYLGYGFPEEFKNIVVYEEQLFDYDEMMDEWKLSKNLLDDFIRRCGFDSKIEWLVPSGEIILEVSIDEYFSWKN